MSNTHSRLHEYNESSFSLETCGIKVVRYLVLQSTDFARFWLTLLIVLKSAGFIAQVDACWLD